jgi:AraC-like DNA-binding protein
MSMVVFLPPQLLSHVRHVFAREPEFFAAQSWKELEGTIRREAVSVAIVDPAADGTVDVDAAAGILQRYPSLPMIGYVMLTATAFGAIAQLSRRGLSHVVLHRFGDSKERLQQMVARVQANPPSQKIMAQLAPVLRQVPLSLARAVGDMFDRPHKYNSVLELSTTADLSSVSVYRYLDTVGLTSPKKLLIAARLTRGLTYLSDPGYSVAEVAMKLGYRHPRIFTSHVLEVFDMTPSRLRSRLTPDDALAHLIRWLDIPEARAPIHKTPHHAQ